MKNNKNLFVLVLMSMLLVPGIAGGQADQSADTAAQEVQQAESQVPVTAIACLHITDTIDSASEFIVSLYKIRKNDAIKALFVYINSGGGKFASAELITDSILEIAKVKPVVAFIENQGCSGAYLIASAADWIIAQHSSYVGSIGVVYTHGFSKQEAVIHLTSGIYKRTYANSEDGFDPIVLQYEQQQVHEVAQHFFKRVAKNRGLSVEQIEAQQARDYVGEQALKEGLIDQICSIDDALAKVVELIIMRGGIVEKDIVLIDAKDGKMLLQL